MFVKRIIRGWGLLLVMAVFVGGSVNIASSESERPQPKGKFVIGTSFNFSNIDPNKTNSGNQTVYLSQSLVHSSVIDYHIQSDLAESWEVINPQTWKFTIRKGVTFHNGQPLTSADVQYSFYRQMGRINRRFPGANKGTWRKLVDQIETPDDYTVVIHTKFPDPSLLSLVRWLFIVPKNHIESVGDKAFSRNPVGTGPFQYKERSVGESLTIEANPNYWNVAPEKGTRGPAKVQTVVYRTMPQEQTRIAAMKTGEIDGTSINRDSIEIFEGDKKFDIHYATKNQSLFIMFNWRDEKNPETGEPNPFADIRVRRALNHAIDVEALIRHYGTGREYRTTILGKHGLGYNPNVPFYEYDPEKAKKLMTEAGYAKGFKTTFFTTTDTPSYIQALHQYIRDIGVQVDIKQTTPSVAMMGMIKKNLYGMLIWGGGMGGPDPAGTFFKTCISYDGNWAIHGKDDQVEALVKKQMTEFDEQKRAKIIDEVIQKLWKDAWFIPLWEPVFIKVVNAKWNYGDSPTTGGFNLPNIRLKE